MMLSGSADSGSGGVGFFFYRLIREYNMYSLLLDFSKLYLCLDLHTRVGSRDRSLARAPDS